MSSHACKKCNKTTFHDDGWDSYFCPLCNSWNEDKCDWDECSYCINRPDTPLNERAHSIFLEAHDSNGFDGVRVLVDYYFELEDKYGSLENKGESIDG